MAKTKGTNNDKQFSIAELERMLAERKAEEAEKLDPKPKPQENIDWKRLIKFVQNDGIDALAATGRVDEDFKHYVFELVLTTIYGKDIWKWWNKRER